MKASITIGSRGSQLAMIQAELVAARIREANPQIKINITPITTHGDRDRRTHLPRMTGVGIFVKELEEALLDGRIDLAVHSLKDVPTEIPRGLALVAVTERLDPRDVLITGGKKLAEMAPGAKIGTGSLRRAAQINDYRSDLEICQIRGNVETRLLMVSDGEIDGLITAAAAMVRLGWVDRITEYLPPDKFVPAVGQGALAIETRADDEVIGLISPINHLPAWQAVTAERAFLLALGGGCQAPIAALGTVTGNILNLAGMAADSSGQKIIRATGKGSALNPEDVGNKLAEKMLAMGAARFSDEAKRG